MPTYTWSSMPDGSTIAFDPNTDVFDLNDPMIPAAAFVITADGDSTTFTFAGKSVTVLTPLETLESTFASGTHINLVANGLILVGDDSTGTDHDAAENTLDGAGTSDQLVGLRGNDT